MLGRNQYKRNQHLLKARVPHNYVLWVASHFHPAMYKTSKALPCCGKRYCFVIDGVPCTPLGTQTSHGFFFFPGGYLGILGHYKTFKITEKIISQQLLPILKDDTELLFKTKLKDWVWHIRDKKRSA